MRQILLTSALLSLSMMLTSAAPTYAQVIPTEDATSTADIVTPNPFPLATTTPPAAAIVEDNMSASSTSTIPPTTVEETPAPTPVAPPAKINKKPVPVKKPIIETPSTSTASTTVFIPPTFTTQISGSIYTYARHAPLSQETTGGFLAVAALSTILGALMVHKRFLDRTAYSISALFSSPRSLPQPQAER